MHKLGPVPVGGRNPVRIMGILNASPESFYKKSVKTSKDSIRDTVKRMEDDGASFIDVGGMSTAPYLSTMISQKEEIRRIEQAIKIIQNSSNLPVSVDTCRAQVAKKALEFGIDILNDITGLKYDKLMSSVISKFTPSLILCAYSKKKVKGNPITNTKKLLQESLYIARKSNVATSKIVLDPAIGFFRNTGSGKLFTKTDYNWMDWDLEIIENLKSIKQRYPVMVSVSNKSFIGKIIGKKDPRDRIYGSIATEVVAVLNGADIIRTHNVSQSKDAISIAERFAGRSKSL